MTLVPITLLFLALLTFVVGVAEGSTVLDYVSIIASGVAFVGVLVVARFGRSERRMPLADPMGYGLPAQAPRAPNPPMSTKTPRPRKPPRSKALDPAELFAGYEELRREDSYGVDSELRLEPALNLVPRTASPREIPLERESWEGPATRAVPVASPPVASPPVASPPVAASGGRVSPPGAPPWAAEVFDLDAQAGYEPSEGYELSEADELYYGDMFPIADYDELRVDEITALLPELDPDEIDVVRAREESGANRPIILRRLDMLEARLSGVQFAPTPIPAPAPIPRPAPPPIPRPAPALPQRPAPALPQRPAPAQVLAPAPIPARPRSPVRPAYDPPTSPAYPSPQRSYGAAPQPAPTAGAVSSASGPAFSDTGYAPLRPLGTAASTPDQDLFGPPIEDYDQLRVIDILAVLSQLDPDEVETLRRYEVAGACRAPILRQIDLLFPLGLPAKAPQLPAPPRRPTAPSSTAGRAASARVPRSWSSPG